MQQQTDVLSATCLLTVGNGHNDDNDDDDDGDGGDGDERGRSFVQ